MGIDHTTTTPPQDGLQISGNRRRLVRHIDDRPLAVYADRFGILVSAPAGAPPPQAADGGRVHYLLRGPVGPLLGAIGRHAAIDIGSGAFAVPFRTMTRGAWSIDPAAFVRFQSRLLTDITGAAGSTSTARAVQGQEMEDAAS